MQFLLRSIGRVGSDLPRLCRWSRWPAALARREAPLMPLTLAHPDLDRLYGSVYEPWRLIPFACGTTKCTDTDNLRRTTAPSEIIEYNPELDDIYVARPSSDSTHRDGAIYKNKSLQEEFYEGDLADRNEILFESLEVGDSHDHTHFANFGPVWLQEILDGSGAATRLEPMMFSKHPDVYSRPRYMFQFFSVMLSKIRIGNGPIQLYGYIAVRDEKDGMLNYILNYSRDNPIVVQQGSLIEMTGPKRGILMGNAVLIEFDMRIKTGVHDEDDLQLIDGALSCSCYLYRAMELAKHRIIGTSGAVDVALAVLGPAAEATIEVVISEVQSGFSLSISSLVDVLDVYEGIQLFDGIIAQAGALRRFVVAVPFSTTMILKFKVGTSHGRASRQIKFQAKLHRFTRRQIRLKAATISVKVNWSSI